MNAQRTAPPPGPVATEPTGGLRDIGRLIIDRLVGFVLAISVPRLALAAGIALIAYLVCFPIARPISLDVGQIGDRLTLSGVNGDERDTGVTYRWTTTRTLFSIPGYGGVRSARVIVIARNGRVDTSGRVLAATVPFTVEIGGSTRSLVASTKWTPTAADLTRVPQGNDLPVTLHAMRYAVTGDSRILGVQVDRIRVEPAVTDWASGALGGWLWAARLMLFAVAIALVVAGRWSGLVGGAMAAVVAILAVAVPESRLILPPLLIPATGAVLGIGTLVRGRRAIRWLMVQRTTLAPLATDAAAPVRTPLTMAWAGLDRRALARTIVGAVIVAYVTGTLVVVAQMAFIGHADYADNAVRARNLVLGRGDVVDYVSQFYRTFPATITHPAETWPPLLVWMIALSFRVAGVSTFAAKLPNIAVMAGLLALVAGIGAWRWGRRVGILAALCLAVSLPFFAGALVPENDLVFTLLFACFVVALYAAWLEPQEAWVFRWRGRAIGGAVSYGALVGLTAGLLVLAKPSGEVLALGAAATALYWVWRRQRRFPGRSVLTAVGIAAFVYAPWAVRNLVTFGSPFHSTETLDAWVLKYDPKQPTEGIYRVFVGKALPHPRELIGYGLDHFLAVQGREVARLWAGLTDGALVPGIVLALAVVGIIVGAARRPGFGALLAGAFVPYTAFVLWYWHYEARYFLVLVPWLALYAASGTVWLAGAAIAHAGKVGRVLGPLLAVAVMVAVIAPGMGDITAAGRAQIDNTETVEIAHWIEANTPPDAVVMTRNPWEISWHSGRRAVMLPLGSTTEIYATMRQYGVTVLELDHINDQSTIRDGIRPLYSWREQPGITRATYNPDANGSATYLIYHVNPTALPSG